MEIPGGWGGVHKRPSGREILRGWGVKTKEPSVVGMDIFWNYTLCPLFLPQILVCYRQFRCQQEPHLAYSIHSKSQHDHGCISSETDRYQGHSM